MEFQEALIEEREAEIREIEGGIHELNEIFRDLGQIVTEQGGMIGECSNDSMQECSHDSICIESREVVLSFSCFVKQVSKATSLAAQGRNFKTDFSSFLLAYLLYSICFYSLSDNIEYNVASIATNTGAADRELVSASDYQRKAGRRAACLMLVVGFVIAVVLLAVSVCQVFSFFGSDNRCEGRIDSVAYFKVSKFDC